MAGCDVSHCGFLRRVVLCAVMSFHVMSFDDVVFCLCLLSCQCPIMSYDVKSDAVMS